MSKPLNLAQTCRVYATVGGSMTFDAKALIKIAEASERDQAEARASLALSRKNLDEARRHRRWAQAYFAAGWCCFFMWWWL